MYVPNGQIQLTSSNNNNNNKFIKERKDKKINSFQLGKKKVDSC